MVAAFRRLAWWTDPGAAVASEATEERLAERSAGAGFAQTGLAAGLAWAGTSGLFLLLGQAATKSTLLLPAVAAMTVWEVASWPATRRAHSATAYLHALVIGFLLVGPGSAGFVVRLVGAKPPLPLDATAVTLVFLPLLRLVVFLVFWARSSGSGDKAETP